MSPLKNSNSIPANSPSAGNLKLETLPANCAMREIQYEHAPGWHTLEEAHTALSKLLAGHCVTSMLDVGCGTGNWLRAALDLGVKDVFGIDGIAVAENKFHIPKKHFSQIDLEQTWALGRRFDLVLCLEVAEHLSPGSADILVRCLTAHGDRILFSAACPGQEGQHHINCQWPGYWQAMFNKFGFRCDDSPRWQIWEENGVAPCYRQNLLLAVKDGAQAGKERRIQRILHPSMFANDTMPDMMEIRRQIIAQVENGSQSSAWYLSILVCGLTNKLRRRLIAKKR